MTQCSDAGEARTRGPSVSSQALYHCAPVKNVWENTVQVLTSSLAGFAYYSFRLLDITCQSMIQETLVYCKDIDIFTLVNVYVDLVVFTRIAGTS